MSTDAGPGTRAELLLLLLLLLLLNAPPPLTSPPFAPPFLTPPLPFFSRHTLHLAFTDASTRIVCTLSLPIICTLICGIPATQSATANLHSCGGAAGGNGSWETSKARESACKPDATSRAASSWQGALILCAHNAAAAVAAAAAAAAAACPAASAASPSTEHMQANAVARRRGASTSSCQWFSDRHWQSTDTAGEKSMWWRGK